MMPMSCESVPGPESLTPNLIGFLDCQAQNLGAEGYRALAASGSPASILLTGMVTLLIAFIGYRMLLGHLPTIREGVLTFVKIGLVLVLATSWPAYQLVVYDVILRAPAEFASSVGQAPALPGGDGGLVARLDGIDQALKMLAIEGVGVRPAGPDGLSALPAVAPPPFMGFDSFALGFARVIFLVGTILSFAIIRIAAGMLLALAPLFATFLLFDGTRGLFEGWAKALIGVALGGFATAIMLGVELAFLEPWLQSLMGRRGSDLDIVGAPAQLLATTTIFAIALAVVIALVGRIAMSLRIPAWTHALVREASGGHAMPSDGLRQVSSSRAAAESRSRAAIVADAVALSQRRDALTTDAQMASMSAPAGRSALHASEAQRTTRSLAGIPGRRTRQRISAHATARDRRQ